MTGKQKDKQKYFLWITYCWIVLAKVSFKITLFYEPQISVLIFDCKNFMLRSFFKKTLFWIGWLTSEKQSLWTVAVPNTTNVIHNSRCNQEESNPTDSNSDNQSDYDLLKLLLHCLYYPIICRHNEKHVQFFSDEISFLIHPPSKNRLFFLWIVFPNTG